MAAIISLSKSQDSVSKREQNPPQLLPVEGHTDLSRYHVPTRKLEYRIF